VATRLTAPRASLGYHWNFPRQAVAAFFANTFSLRVVRVAWARASPPPASGRSSNRAASRSPNLKLDPYINVDPGTMSPYQHGEVFVTDDGAETDLDLGHYERFTSAPVSQAQQLHHRPDLRTSSRRNGAATTSAARSR
jgi:hypothetical protein